MCWWCWMKSERTAQAIQIHPLGTMNVYTEFHGHDHHQQLLSHITN